MDLEREFEASLIDRSEQAPSPRDVIDAVIGHAARRRRRLLIRRSLRLAAALAVLVVIVLVAL